MDGIFLVFYKVNDTHLASKRDFLPSAFLLSTSLSEFWEYILIILQYIFHYILNRKVFISKSLNLQLICSCSPQVLKQLNVFAEEDIDTAAEALNDVSFYIFISQHAFYSYFCVIEFLKQNKLSTKLSLKSNNDYQIVMVEERGHILKL